MNAKESGRRKFLKGGVALAGLAVGGLRVASGQSSGAEAAASPHKDSRTYGERSRFDTAERQPTGAAPYGDTALVTPIQALTGIITPAGLHFVMDHLAGVPDIDPQQHRLMIHGMVDRPLIFTVEELKRLPSVSRIHFLECNANSRPLQGPKAESVQQVHGKTSCSEWTGVLLSLLLQEASVQAGASWLVSEGAEGNKYTKSLPLAKAMEDVLVAYGQNGEPVRPEQGFPLRLLVPGWEANYSTKWLRRIKIVDQPYMTQHESTHNANLHPDGKAHWFRFEMGVKSVITRPCGGQKLPSPGFYEITGLAWSGGGTVRKVEVSTDGGRTWKNAELQQPVHRKAHTRFRLPWTWDGNETILQSRCTDDQGEMQPTIAELAKIWEVSTDYFLGSGVDHFNAIQPWKVNRDGSVHNALFS
ncbi:MAG: sulfite dehydrogenase [Acidobacteria bacterium]|nr:sulfite dehydrogenase [Acidobacteriota bacterium]